MGGPGGFALPAGQGWESESPPVWAGLTLLQNLVPPGRGGRASSLPFQYSLPIGFLLRPVQSWEVAELSCASVCRNQATQMGQTPAEMGLRSSLCSLCTGLSGYLYGSLFHAQVLPLSFLGSADSPMEHADVLMVHGTARGAGRGLVRRGPAAGTTPCWAGTGQPKALGACCH